MLAPAIVVVDVIKPAVRIAGFVCLFRPGDVRNASPIVLAIDGCLGIVVAIHSPGVMRWALVACEFCRGGEVEDANIVCITAVPRVGAVVATAIAMAIVPVVVIALFEPKAAGNCLDKLCTSAFGASDGISAIA